MLNNILSAKDRIDGVAKYTPVLTSSSIDAMFDKQIYFKCENFQRGGSFKIRGAYNTISQLSDKEKSNGIITHSSGNHAQAVAISGQILDIPTTIVMPNNAPKVKVEATRGYGAKVVLCAPTMKAREKTCKQIQTEKDLTLIHPYDNDEIIAGAATASLELLEEIPNLDLIMAPIGGGGLISGTSLFTKLSDYSTKVYGGEPSNADDAYRGFYNGTRITSQDPNTIADGLRTTLSKRTYEYISEYVDEIFLGKDETIVTAMQTIWERMKIVIEPSSAVPLATIFDNQNQFSELTKIGIILSGGNIDINEICKYL